MKIIAHIENDFSTKFGIPRQSGLVNSLRSRIVFAPEYRNPGAFRGLEDFSHVWLIWEFSQAVRQKWSPTERPPRLGGNTRMGVFATRSPFRPNPVGLSAVQLEEVVLHGADAPYLVVSGADLMNGTPIYDIKPYLPHIDSHPDARGGIAVPAAEHRLKETDIEQYAAAYTARIKAYREYTRQLDATLVRRLLDKERLMKVGESDGFRLKLHFDWFVILKRENERMYAPFKYAVNAYCLDNIQTFDRRYVTLEDALLHCLNGFNENANIPNRYKSIGHYLSGKS